MNYHFCLDRIYVQLCKLYYQTGNQCETREAEFEAYRYIKHRNHGLKYVFLHLNHLDRTTRGTQVSATNHTTSKFIIHLDTPKSVLRLISFSQLSNIITPTKPPPEHTSIYQQSKCVSLSDTSPVRKSRAAQRISHRVLSRKEVIKASMPFP